MASKNLTEGQKTKLTSLFKALDANGDGFLDIVRFAGEKSHSILPDLAPPPRFQWMPPFPS